MRIGSLTQAEADWAWGGDGRSLVICHRAAPAILGRSDSCLESGRAHRLRPPLRSALTFLDTTPRLSPDGRTMAFVRVHDAALHNAALVALDLTSDRSSVLVGFDRFVGTEIDWSPDGRWLAYTSAPGGASPRNLWIVRADGSQQRQLTDLGPAQDASSPSFSPDGTRIAVGIHRAGTDEIAVVDLIDGQLTTVVEMRGLRLRGLEWGPVVR